MKKINFIVTSIKWIIAYSTGTRNHHKGEKKDNSREKNKIATVGMRFKLSTF